MLGGISLYAAQFATGARGLRLAQVRVDRVGELVPVPGKPGHAKPEMVQVYPRPDTGLTSAPGRIKANSRIDETVTVAGAHQTSIMTYLLEVDRAAGPFNVGDVVTVLESFSNANLMGQRFRISILHDETIQTGQRMTIEEESSWLSKSRESGSSPRP